MQRTTLFTMLIILCLFGLFELKAAAQGGWRQGDIYLRDGGKLEANPLSASDGRVSLSLKSDATPGEGIELSKIDYIAARVSGLPPAPTGNFKQDLVVLTDGSRLVGPITSLSAEFSEGSVVQNKKRISLKDIAYIKFTEPKQMSTNSSLTPC